MTDVLRWQLPLIKSFTDLRYHTEKVTSLAKKKLQPVIIAKNNKPEAILLSVKTFEELLTYLQKAQDRQDTAESEAMLKAVKSEEWVPIKKVAKELLGVGYVRRYLRSTGGKATKKTT